MKMNDGKGTFESLKLEYTSLREEIAMRTQREYQIIGLGLGGLITLLGLSFQLQIYPIMLILPLVIISSMILFHLEEESIQSIKLYMRCGLEKKLLGDTIKGREQWEYETEPMKKKPYTSHISKSFETASLLLLLALLAGCCIGIITYFTGNLKNDWPDFMNWLRYVIAIIYGAGGLSVLIYTWSKKNQECPKYLKKQQHIE